MTRRAWFLILASVAAVVLIAVLGLTHLRIRTASSRFPERGTVSERIPGCPARVEILIDARGNPHVRTDSRTAVWFAQGYLHARDRFFQMEMARRTAQGRLAEVFGEAALESDSRMRNYRLEASARRQAALLSATERPVLDAYTNGVNAAIAEYGKWIAPEIWMLGVPPEPWTIEDSLSIGVLIQLELSWSMSVELQRAAELAALGRDKAVELWGWTPSEASSWIPPGDGLTLPLRDRAAFAPNAAGSNSWAVSGELSASGRPLLANDPHLAVQMPTTFYAIHLSSRDLDVAGVSLAGIPGVIIGHTAEVAWGLTMTMMDDQDLFVLSLDDAGNREMVDGRWQPLRTVAEDINVRWQPNPVLVKIRLSENGPVIREHRNQPLALAWTGLHGPSMLSAILAMNRAESVAEAAGAWTGVIGPSMNLVAADTGGHILHQVVGKPPIRGRGAGRLPAPGSDSQWAWAGFRNYSDNPSRLDPGEGYVAAANHDLFSEGDYPGSERFPGDFDSPWRVRRIRSALAARADWSIAEFLELQDDVISGRAIAILKQLWGDLDEHGGRAAIELQGWDARMDPESIAARVYAELLVDLGSAVGGDEAARDGLEASPIGPEELLRLLAGGLGENWWDDVTTPDVETREEIVRRVLDQLDGAGGRSRWGDVHRVHFKHPLEWIPVVGRLVRNSWSRGPVPAPGNNVTVNAHYWNRGRPFDVTAIPAMRFVTEVGNWDETRLVLPVGQSGRPWSANYANQISDWLAGEAQPFPFSREAVDAAAVAKIYLIPERAPESAEGGSR
jgi:penicillin amidase